MKSIKPLYKYILLFLLFKASGLILFAQNSTQTELNANKAIPFTQIRDKYNKIFDAKIKANIKKIKKMSKTEAFENFEESDDEFYAKFKRYEYFANDRLDENGFIKSGNHYIKELNSFKDNSKNARTQASVVWKSLGPFKNPSSLDQSQPPAGVGRVNIIASDPVQSNVLYIGSAGGGLWKSTDKGTTWNFLNFSGFPCIGITDIKISPTNPNTIYVLTGDGEAESIAQYNDRSIPYSIGILKSIDGGQTWSQTGWDNNLDQSSQIFCYRIIINPTNENILYVATDNGVYKSTDGAANWTLISQNQLCKDIAIDKSNPNILYGAFNTGTNVFAFRRYDASSNAWNSEKVYSDCSRMVFGVTPAQPKYVFILMADAFNGGGSGFRSLERSTNEGVAWTTISSKSDGVSINFLANEYNGLNSQTGKKDANGQGYYSLGFAIDPRNALNIYLGGVNIFGSADGGKTFTCIGEWTGGYGIPQVHADIHCLYFDKDYQLYSGSDGGIDYYDGNQWNSINDNLAISQIYRLSFAQKSNSDILMGLQDNASNVLSGAKYTQGLGGDGFDCWVHPTDANVMLASDAVGTAGVFWKSTDGGKSFGQSPTLFPLQVGEYNNFWVSPIAGDPSLPNTVYVGLQNLYKSTDAGSNWKKVTTLSSLLQDNIRSVAVANSDSKVVYVSSGNSLYKTVNSGTSWTKVYSAPQIISRIAVDPVDPTIAYITMVGFSKTNKVYKITGTTGTNISYNLPNVPVSCIVHQKSSTNNRIFVGTDLGVYTTDDDNSGNWSLYGDQLSNVMVSDLKINYASGTIIAATFGRGVWSTKLTDCSLAAPTLKTSTNVTNPSKIALCTGDSITLELTGDNSNYIVKWSNGSTANKIVIKSAGTYNVQITDFKGCSANSLDYVVTYTTVPQVTFSNLTNTNVSICEGDSITVTVGGFTTFNKYLWSNGATTKTVNLKDSGDYFVVCTLTANQNCNSTSSKIHVSVLPSPIKPTITVNKNDLTSSVVASAYQWYLNGNAIGGANSQTLTAITSGKYTVAVKNSNNCQKLSDPIDFTPNSIENLIESKEFEIVPNPNSGEFTINMGDVNLKIDNVKVFDLLGNILYENVDFLFTKGGNYSISLKNLKTGTYFLEIDSGSKTYLKKLIKQ